MRFDLKRLYPILLTVITLSTGIIVLLSFFSDDPGLQAFRGVLVEWTVIVAAFAILMGVLNVLRVHAQRIRERQGAFYSLIALLGFLLVFVPGILSVPQSSSEAAVLFGPQGTIVTFVYRYIQRPLQSTLFSLMAFFVATAAWRAFRIRSAASLVMFIAAVFVLLGSIYLDVGDAWKDIVKTKDWILAVPTTAGARGILLGIVLGTVVTGIRFLLGIEHPYSD
ncbi:MAG: hypothetical protein JW934_01035 [Anaerolineae bacterium]|nr:hypothetical protein [Anaerolineae bacterium]